MMILAEAASRVSTANFPERARAVSDDDTSACQLFVTASI
jgi:hypothetical protein